MNTPFNPVVCLLNPIPELSGMGLLCFYRWLKFCLKFGFLTPTYDELAKCLALPKSALIRMVNTLHEAGYVEVLEDPDNRRGGKIRVVPTDKLARYVGEISKASTPDNAAEACLLLDAPYLVGDKKFDLVLCKGKLSGAQLVAMASLVLVADKDGVVKGVSYSTLQNLSGQTRSAIQALIKRLTTVGFITWYIPGGIEMPRRSARQRGEKGVKRSSWMIINLQSVSPILDVQAFVVSLGELDNGLYRLSRLYEHYGAAGRNHGSRGRVFGLIFRLMRADEMRSGMVFHSPILIELCDELHQIELGSGQANNILADFRRRFSVERIPKNLVSLLYSLFEYLHMERMEVLGLSHFDMEVEDFLLVSRELATIEFFTGTGVSRTRLHFVITRTIEHIFNSGMGLEKGRLNAVWVQYLKRSFMEAYGDVSFLKDLPRSKYFLRLISHIVTESVISLKCDLGEKNVKETTVLRLARYKDGLGYLSLVYNTK